MQSFSPQIIKHYIPFQFSINILDLEGIPKQKVGKKQDNPLQNIKLRNLQKQQQKQLVLTYKNKTNDLFKSKKSLKYKHILHQLGQQHQKMKIIKEQINQNQKESAIRQKQLWISNGSINQLYEDKYEVNEKAFHTARVQRKVSSQQTKKRNWLMSRRNTLENYDRPVTLRLHSSSHFRQTQRAIADFSKTSELQKSPVNQVNKISLKKLKIRGRQAPQKQVVDHLRRSASYRTDQVIHINKCDKK